MKKILYGLVYGLWYALSLLPSCVLYGLADVLFVLSAYVIRYRHRVIQKNLRNAFPERSDRERRRIELRFYRWFCDYLVETIKLMTMKKDEMMKRMTFSNIEILNEAVSRGQSVALYLGHYGNWEWITTLPLWISSKPQCCQLYHPLENSEFDRLFKHVRERHHSLCVPMEESVRRLIKYSQAGSPLIVGFIADQAPLWQNMHHWTTFLNQDTPVLTGAERIARKMNMTIVYGDMRRIKRGHYRCDFQLMASDPSKTTEWELTDKYFQLLEQTIRRDPSCYLWSHNRWKRTREEFNHYCYVDEHGKVMFRKNVGQYQKTKE
ncbi:MAG: lysophospholipid acyltransferase family protein [Prevotella sp.]|nr:lysophospholipid acyltransferase family protein [Prevotella sp.]MDY4039981.1 lysophospholipid acyltransferase family protein [Prevotella sp.]